ncbi:hypothetical protein ACOZB2_03880 [Pantoea endophytica]|uniref:Uncharacterized protein n=1 Tax=Pantoea sp. BJ2 TaxID=3141322 RepID=A0AAU7U477_9GAMM
MHIDLDTIKRARRAQLKALENGEAKRPQALSQNKELKQALEDFERVNNRRKNKVAVM